MSELKVRKYVAYIEDTLIEGHKDVSVPVRMASVAAVLHNPGQAGLWMI